MTIHETSTFHVVESPRRITLIQEARATGGADPAALVAMRDWSDLCDWRAEITSQLPALQIALSAMAKDELPPILLPDRTAAMDGLSRASLIFEMAAAMCAAGFQVFRRNEMPSGAVN